MVTTRQKLLLFNKTPVLPPFMDLFNRADGAVGNNWIGSTWSISGNAIVNTPNETEKTINPGAEGVYVSGLAPNWSSAVHTGVRAEENVIIHGGASAPR